MAATWILKTEPSTYAFADLVRDRRTRWDGIRNPVAQKHLRAMQPGDEAWIYHTGAERQIVGRARVVSPPYPDPTAGGLYAVDLEAGDPFPRPVSLATIKGDPRCAELALVRQGRLSVVPVPLGLRPVLAGWGGLS